MFSRRRVKAKAAPPAKKPQAVPPGGEPVTVSIKRANILSIDDCGFYLYR